MADAGNLWHSAFSAPAAWVKFWPKGSKLAYFKIKNTRYFETFRGFVEIFRKTFGIFRHFCENFPERYLGDFTWNLCKGLVIGEVVSSVCCHGNKAVVLYSRAHLVEIYCKESSISDVVEIQNLVECMTSHLGNLHILKKLNISGTKREI